MICYTDLKADEILHVLDEESKDPRTDVDMFAGEIIVTIYGPVIYTAPSIRILMRADG